MTGLHSLLSQMCRDESEFSCYWQNIPYISMPYLGSFLLLQVGDPYTAIALKGMLEALLDQGAIIVCTSNTPIRRLNCHGVHEDLFSGFQERLLDALDEVELNASQDYRLSFAQAALEQVWARVVGPDANLDNDRQEQLQVPRDTEH